MALDIGGAASIKGQDAHVCLPMGGMAIKVRMRVPAAEWGEMGPMQYMYQRLGEYCYDQVGAAQCVLDS